MVEAQSTEERWKERKKERKDDPLLTVKYVFKQCNDEEQADHIPDQL